MDVLYERCVGLDVHRDTVVACLITPAGRELLSFGTMTAKLLTLADLAGRAAGVVDAPGGIGEGGECADTVLVEGQLAS